MSEIWNLSALCRCCHSDGNFKSLYSQYAVKSGGKTYSCILEETLGIQIDPAPFEASHTICDTCIRKLTHAAEFKNLVLSCEAKFKEYCKNELSQKFNADCIKYEPNYDDADDYGADDKSELDIVTCKQEYNVTIKSSNEEHNKEQIASMIEISAEPIKRDTAVKDSKNYVKRIGVKEPKKRIGANKNRIKQIKVEKSKCKPKVDSKSEVKEETENHFLIKCEHCNKRFKQEKYLNCHISKNHEIFKCEFCLEMFNGKGRFLDHLKTHKNDRLYNCKYCQKTFNDAHSVYNHEFNHTKPKYRCDICKKEFTTKSILKKHILWHYGQNKKVLCDLCGHSFNDKCNLLKHIQSVHERLRPYACEICEKKYSTLRHLRTHQKLAHEPTIDYKCEKCHKTYKNTKSLEIHELKHNNKYKCRYCGAVYDDRNVYLSHRMVHKLDKTNSTENISTHVKCEMCSNYFSSKYSLKRHMAVHKHIKEFSCSLCNSNFTQKDSLTRHIKRSHGPKGVVKLVKCTICNRNSSNIDKHMRAHTNKHFNCMFCAKAYSNSSALNRHVKEVHLGTVHECDICGKTYNLIKSLRAHRFKVHNVSWKTESAKGERFEVNIE